MRRRRIAVGHFSVERYAVVKRVFVKRWLQSNRQWALVMGTGAILRVGDATLVNGTALLLLAAVRLLTEPC